MVTCPYCKEDQGEIDAGFHCNACGRNEEGAVAARDYVEDVMGVSEYSAVTKGGVWPLSHCSDCGNNSFVDFGPPEELGLGLRALCFTCGYELANPDPNDIERGGADHCLKCGRLFDSKDGMSVCDDCLAAAVED